MLSFEPDAWKNFFVYDSDFSREVNYIWTMGLQNAGLEAVPAGGKQLSDVQGNRFCCSAGLVAWVEALHWMEWFAALARASHCAIPIAPSRCGAISRGVQMAGTPSMSALLL